MAQHNRLTLDTKNRLRMASRACDDEGEDSVACSGTHAERWQPVVHGKVLRTAKVNINNLWFRHSATCDPGRNALWSTLTRDM